MVYEVLTMLKKVFNKIIAAPIKKHALGCCGSKVSLGSGLQMYGSKNIFIGNNVSINNNALFMCTRAKVVIGDDVMFGPNVTVITGTHRTDIVGRIMITVGNDEKLPENDKEVVFEGDNWIGARAVILRGVTVGRGSIVAAGSIVTKDVPSYSIVGGIPAQVIKMRFDEETLEEHIRLIQER